MRGRYTECRIMITYEELLRNMCTWSGKAVFWRDDSLGMNPATVMFSVATDLRGGRMLVETRMRVKSL